MKHHLPLAVAHGSIDGSTGAPHLGTALTGADRKTERLFQALRGQDVEVGHKTRNLNVARRLLADFGLDTASFYGRYGITLAKALGEMRSCTVSFDGLRGAAVLLGEALEASIVVSSGQKDAETQDELVKPLTDQLRKADVIDAVRRLYGLDGDTLPAGAACAKGARNTLLASISWDEIEVHRVGTTSLLLKAPRVNVADEHYLIKLVHFLFQNVAPIANATKLYYDTSLTIRNDAAGKAIVPAVRASGDGWVIQDFVDGMTVSEYLSKQRRDGNLSPKSRLELLRHVYIPIVGALAHLHKKGVVHGDLNPSNIILANTTPRRHTGYEVASEHTPVRFIDLGRNLLASDVIGRVKSPDAHFVDPDVISLPPEAQALERTADYYSLGLLLPLCLGVASPDELRGGQIPDELFAWEPLLARVMADLADPEAAQRLEVLRRDRSKAAGRSTWRSRLAGWLAAQPPAAVGTNSGRDPDAERNEAAPREDLEELAEYLETLCESLSKAGERPTGERQAIALLREVLWMVWRPGRLVRSLSRQMTEHELPQAGSYRYLAGWVRAVTVTFWLSVIVVVVSLWSRYGDAANIDVLHVSADQLRVFLGWVGISFDKDLNARYNEACVAASSFACTTYLYYISAFRYADLRHCAPANWFARASEWMMRGLPMLVLPSVVAANFIAPEQLVWFSALGVALGALTTALVSKRTADVIKNIRNTLAHESSLGYWRRLESSKRLQEWVPMLSFTTGVYVVLAAYLATGVGSDHTLPVIWITAVNILGFGIVQTKRSVEEVAPSLARTAVLAERLTALNSPDPKRAARRSRRS
jgi:hypothetical protein